MLHVVGTVAYPLCHWTVQWPSHVSWPLATSCFWHLTTVRRATRWSGLSTAQEPFAVLFVHAVQCTSDITIHFLNLQPSFLGIFWSCVMDLCWIFMSSMTLLTSSLRCCIISASVQSTSHPRYYKTQTFAKTLVHGLYWLPENKTF